MQLPQSHANAAVLYGPEFAVRPAEVYERIRREHGPVAPVLIEGDLPAWLVLGYREIHHVCRNPQIFSRLNRLWNLWDEVPADWPLRPFMEPIPALFNAEGTDRQRRAAAVNDALEATDPIDMSRICERSADQLIDAFAGDGKADLMSQYALQLPMMALSRLYGFPESEIPQMTADLVAMSTATSAEALAANQRVMAGMAQLVGKYRVQSGASLTSRLVNHRSALPNDDLIVDMFVLMIFGQAPTTDWIGNALRLMFLDDDFSLTLQGGRSSVGQALNEVLWKDTPIQQIFGRFPTQDCELGGRLIGKGDLVILGAAAANADPQANPGELGSLAANRAHMSFGRGEYGCPSGAADIAELIARTAVEVLLDRIPDAELAVPAAEVRWKQTSVMRGLESLPVTFTPVYTR